MKLTVKGAPVSGGVPLGAQPPVEEDTEQKKPAKEPKPKKEKEKKEKEKKPSKLGLGRKPKKVEKTDDPVPVETQGNVETPSQVDTVTPAPEQVVEGAVSLEDSPTPELAPRKKLDMSAKKSKAQKQKTTKAPEAAEATPVAVMGEPVEMELDMEEISGDVGGLTITFIIMFSLSIIAALSIGFLSGGFVGNLLGGLL